MGMFDTVYVSQEALAKWSIECRSCGRASQPDAEWQTKSLESCLNSYYLRPDDKGSVRLYLLDRPTDRRFWRAWSEQEIAESARMAERGGTFPVLERRAGDGCFLPEAYLPQNRRQRFMGELPHQWVEIYARCACGEPVERWIKFSDGIATEIRFEAPSTRPAC